MSEPSRPMPGVELNERAERLAGALRAATAALLFLLVLAIYAHTGDPAGDVKWLLLGAGAAVLGVAWAVSVQWGGISWRRPRLFLEILGLWLALGLVSVALSAYRGYAFSQWRPFCSLFLVYLVASQVYRTPDQVRVLAATVCVAVGVASVYGLLFQSSGSDPFPWADTGGEVYRRLPGTFGHPEYAAYVLVSAFVLAFALGRGQLSLGSWAFAAVFAAHLWYTGYAFAWIVLAGAVVVPLTAAVLARWSARPVRAAVGGSVVGVLFVVVAIGGLAAWRFTTTGAPVPSEPQALAAWSGWPYAARMALASPVLGHGPGAYRREAPGSWSRYEQEWFVQDGKQSAHVQNDLLEIAVDSGLPAAGLYLTFLILAGGYGLLLALDSQDAGRRRVGWVVAAFFWAFLLTGLYGFNLHTPVSGALLFALAGALDGLYGGSAGKPVLSVHDRQGLLVRTARLWPFAAAAAAVTCAVFAGIEFRAQKFLCEGETLIHWQRYDAAAVVLERAAALTPWNAPVSCQLANACAGKGAWTDAAAHLDRALEEEPYAVAFLTAAANAHLNAALEDLAKRDSLEREQLAVLDAAAERARHALDLCPLYTPAEEAAARVASSRANLLGRVAGVTPDEIAHAWRDAETHLRRAVLLGAPNAGELYRQWAQVCLALDDKDTAEDALARAIQTSPTDDLAWLLFYRFARDSGRVERFQREIEYRIDRIKTDTPPDPNRLATASLWLAEIVQHRNGGLDRAETIFREALTESPLFPALWSGYARFAESNRRPDAFRAFLLANYSETLSRGLIPLPHVAALAKTWNEGPAELPKASAGLVAVIQEGKPVADVSPAGLDMKWALALLAEQAQADGVPAETRGLALMHLGMVCAGIRELELANRLFPAAMGSLSLNDQAVCAQHWADVLVRLERADEAVALLRAVAGRNPEDRDVLLALARCLAKAGATDDARTEYEKLLGFPQLPAGEHARIQTELDALPR